MCLTLVPQHVLKPPTVWGLRWCNLEWWCCIVWHCGNSGCLGATPKDSKVKIQAFRCFQPVSCLLSYGLRHALSGISGVSPVQIDQRVWTALICWDSTDCQPVWDLAFNRWQPTVITVLQTVFLSVCSPVFFHDDHRIISNCIPVISCTHGQGLHCG